MQKYGFKCVSAFRGAKGVPESTFDAIMRDEAWKLRKHVLLHRECPLRIREQVRLNGKWYERLTAINAKWAPKDYFNHALTDKDKRVRHTYSRKVMWKSYVLRGMLFKLGVIKGEWI